MQTMRDGNVCKKAEQTEGGKGIQSYECRKHTTGKRGLFTSVKHSMKVNEMNEDILWK